MVTKPLQACNVGESSITKPLHSSTSLVSHYKNFSRNEVRYAASNAAVHMDLAKSAPPSFATLIAEGNVVPDEFDGPYVHNSYHANVTGEERGYRFKAGRDEWKKNNRENLAKLDDWSSIDPEYLDEYGIDPDYMFSYGTINGKSVNMQELRPEVIAAKQEMRACYDEAFKGAREKFGAAEVFGRILALPEKRGTMQQPGGEQLDIIGLYKGALGALEHLWQYGQQALEVSGEAAGPRALVSAAWGIKKAPSMPVTLTIYLSRTKPQSSKLPVPEQEA